MAEVSLADLMARWRAVARAQQRCPASEPGAALAIACEEQGLVELRKGEFGAALKRAEDAARRADVSDLPAMYADLARAAARYPAPAPSVVARLVDGLEAAARGEGDGGGRWKPRLVAGLALAAAGALAWRVLR